MTSRTVRRRAFPLLLVATLALAACSSGDDDPVDDLDPAPSGTGEGSAGADATPDIGIGENGASSEGVGDDDAGAAGGEDGDTDVTTDAGTDASAESPADADAIDGTAAGTPDATPTPTHRLATLATSDADGTEFARLTWNYDAEGRLIGQSIDVLDPDAVDASTSYAYAADGTSVRVETDEDADGVADRITTVAFDGGDRASRTVENRDGDVIETTVYARDPATDDLVASVDGADGEIDGVVDRTIIYRYGADGRVAGADVDAGNGTSATETVTRDAAGTTVRIETRPVGVGEDVVVRTLGYEPGDCDPRNASTDPLIEICLTLP